MVPRAEDQEVTASAERRRAQLMDEITEVGFVLPGSIVMRSTRCGNRGCRCRGEPPQLHGPYATWTRKVANKTVTKTLSGDQVERYRPWFDNARRLRELLRELEALSLQTVDRAEGWGRK
jgi:hypothetical protein